MRIKNIILTLIVIFTPLTVMAEKPWVNGKVFVPKKIFGHSEEKKEIDEILLAAIPALR